MVGITHFPSMASGVMTCETIRDAIALSRGLSPTVEEPIGGGKINIKVNGRSEAM